MRRPLNAAVLLLALAGGVWGAGSAVQAQSGPPLPATPRLPSFGTGLFGRKPAQTSTQDTGAGAKPSTDRPVLRGPATTQAGREATLQTLQDCYAREAPKVRGGAAAETRVRRLRLACENEEIADTRAWLKWSKLGDSRQGRRIVNAIQEDNAEKALVAAAVPPAPEKS